MSNLHFIITNNTKGFRKTEALIMAPEEGFEPPT